MPPNTMFVFDPDTVEGSVASWIPLKFVFMDFCHLRDYKINPKGATTC